VRAHPAVNRSWSRARKLAAQARLALHVQQRESHAAHLGGSSANHALEEHGWEVSEQSGRSERRVHVEQQPSGERASSVR